MALPRVLPTARATAALQALIRTFGAKPVHVQRITGHTRTAGHTQGPPVLATVYRGEALFVPAGATVQVMGLGPLPTQEPHLLVAGDWRFLQGDVVSMDSREYTVDSQPNRWHVFSVLKLAQSSKTGATR